MKQMRILRISILVLISVTFPLGMVFGAESISIDSHGQPLGKVLQRTSQESGIQFQVPDKFKEIQLNKKVQASNWRDAVRKLLDNFNLVELYGERGKLRKVFLLGVQDPEQNLISASTSLQPLKKRPMRVTEISLSKAQLRELAKGPFRSPLPDHLYYDPQIKKFLKLHNIAGTGDFKNTQKAMRVRVEARRQLKLLHKEGLISAKKN
jgi:hypothetical protein